MQSKTTERKKPRVLIFESHDQYRGFIKDELLKWGLAEDLVTVGSMDDFLFLSEKEQFDIALVDSSQIRAGDLHFWADWRERHGDTRLVALALFGNSWQVGETLNLGFQGYLLKGAIPEELGPAMKTIRAGKLYISADALKKEDDEEEKRLEGVNSGGQNQTEGDPVDNQGEGK